MRTPHIAVPSRWLTRSSDALRRSLCGFLAFAALRQVSLSHTGAGAFAGLLGFLYTDSLDPDMEPHDAMELLMLANEFVLPPLEMLCEVREAGCIAWRGVRASVRVVQRGVCAPPVVPLPHCHASHHRTRTRHAPQSLLIRALDVDNAPALLDFATSLHQATLAAAASHIIIENIDTVAGTPEFKAMAAEVQAQVRGLGVFGCESQCLCVTQPCACHAHGS